MWLSRKSRIAIGMVAVALMTVSCGSGESEAAGEIKIGWSGPFSGQLQSLARTNEAAMKIALEEVNKDGGPAGKKINLIIKDDALSAEKAVTQARQFITQDNIDLMMGPAVNTPFLASQPIFASANKVQILVGTAATGINPEKYPNTWRAFFSGDDEAKLIVERLRDVYGAKKIAILAENTGSGLPGVDSLKKAISSVGGVELTTTQIFPSDNPDLTSYVSKIKDSGAEGIALWAVGGRNTSNVVKALDAAELYLPLVGDIGADFKATPELAGEALERVKLEAATFRTELYEPDGEPSAQLVALRDEIKKRMGVDELPDAFHLATMYYNAMHVVATALDRSNGNARPEAFNKALTSEKITTPLGDIYDFTGQRRDGFVAENLSFAEISADSYRDGFWRRAKDAPAASGS